MITTQPAGLTSPQEVISNSQEIMGKDDFLKLLITQLRNQDPLNPMKSEEFAAQLAQFSSVEQLRNINSNLQNATEVDLLLNQALNNTLATTLIGKNVRAISNLAVLGDDGKANIAYHIDAAAEQVTLEIMDENGTTVRTVQLSEQTAGDHNYQWDGKDNDGHRLEPGRYTIAIRAEDSNGESVHAQTYLVGTINGVRYDNGNAVLRIGNLDVELSDVIEIRANEDTKIERKS